MSDSKNIKTTSFAAAILGISVVHLCRLVSAGMPKESYGLYDVVKCAEWIKAKNNATRPCLVCGKEIRPPRKRCRACLEKTAKQKRERHAAKIFATKRRNTKPCPVCGIEFCKPQQTCCSRPCAAALASKPKVARVQSACEKCGKQISFRATDARRFCSAACSAGHDRKRIAVKCFRCGIKFEKAQCHAKKTTRVTRGHNQEPKKHFCSKDCARSWQKENRKRSEDTPKKRIYRKVSGMIRSALKVGRVSKSFVSILGYTPEELANHLERKFTAGMGWHNYGSEWHLDHIIPLARLNYSTTEDPDFKRAWSLNNLQPLWAIDNMVKSDRIERPVQPSLSFGAAA